MSLGFGDHGFDRSIQVEVGQAETVPPLLACLDHKRGGVAILTPPANVHRAANGQIAQDRVNQPQHRITFRRRSLHCHIVVVWPPMLPVDDWGTRSRSAPPG